MKQYNAPIQALRSFLVQRAPYWVTSGSGAARGHKTKPLEIIRLEALVHEALDETV